MGQGDMHQGRMLLYDVGTMLKNKNIECSVIDLKDRASLVVHDKRKREEVHEIAVKYFKKWATGEGRAFNRRSTLTEMRCGNLDWVIGQNLDESQFNIAVCSIIVRDGYAINIL